MCYPRYDREIELPCPRLSLYSIKRLTLQMEKKEPARRSVARPQTRSRAKRDQQQSKARPSQQAPQADTMQLGSSMEHMSFEEAYGYYTHDILNPYQAGSSMGYGQGPYYPQVCRVVMVHRWVLRHQHGLTLRTRLYGVSRSFQTASTPSACSSNK